MNKNKLGLSALKPKPSIYQDSIWLHGYLPKWTSHLCKKKGYIIQIFFFFLLSNLGENSLTDGNAGALGGWLSCFSLYCLSSYSTQIVPSRDALRKSLCISVCKDLCWTVISFYLLYSDAFISVYLSSTIFTVIKSRIPYHNYTCKTT